MIQTILVPTDGSEAAGKAVTLAGDLARKYGAGMVLVHVPPRGHIPQALLELAESEHLVEDKGWHGEIGLPGDTAAALEDIAAEELAETAATRVGRWILDRAQRSLVSSGGPQPKLRMEEGDAAEVILGLIEEEKADLLVMGSLGLSSLKGLLLGSLSLKLSQLAPCSCLLVK